MPPAVVFANTDNESRAWHGLVFGADSTLEHGIGARTGCLVYQVFRGVESQARADNMSCIEVGCFGRSALPCRLRAYTHCDVASYSHPTECESFRSWQGTKLSVIAVSRLLGVPSCGPTAAVSKRTSGSSFGIRCFENSQPLAEVTRGAVYTKRRIAFLFQVSEATLRCYEKLTLNEKETVGLSKSVDVT